MKILASGPRRVAVVQPLPGVGDMIWHLPHIRALSRHVGHPMTLVAKPRSAADVLFKAEETVEDVLWLDRDPKGRPGAHDGLSGMVRLVAALRARRFDAIVLLHHSRSLAFAALCAGIPERYGYGDPSQRPFLNRPPYLPAAMLRLHPFERASAWLAAAGVRLEEAEPRLAVSADSEAKALQALGKADPRPIALGIGSSEPHKQWGAERFAELAARLLEPEGSRLALIGGAGEAALVDDILARLGAGAAHVFSTLSWDLGEVAALLSLSAFYVGNDTGFMNMAAAVGVRSFCLFGGTPPFRHSRNIVPILPPDGRPDKAGGMARITVSAVLEALRTDPGARAALEPEGSFAAQPVETAGNTASNAARLFRDGRLPPGTALAPIGFGELIDKISILEIKKERILDAKKNANVRLELDALNAALAGFEPLPDAFPAMKSELRGINEALWDIEDQIRDCEREKNFGEAFIELARSVYVTNDRRAAVKRQLNELVGSSIVEEKSYREF